MARGGPRNGNGRGRAGPQVVFRIDHVAHDDAFPATDGSSPPSYGEQAVEIAQGPSPTFPNGRVAALVRRVPLERVVNAVPPSHRK